MSRLPNICGTCWVLVFMLYVVQIRFRCARSGSGDFGITASYMKSSDSTPLKYGAYSNQKCYILNKEVVCLVHRGLNNHE